ncbi:MAG: DUF4468 domain-containing protein [Lutibacter sp.]|nr:DUF4468 domain-containing protein [Lutibacter sp.]
MKHILSILALFMSIYTFSQNLFEVSAESPVFPPKEVFIDISNLSDKDNYELVKDWLSVNFNSDDNLVIDQECNNFITLASTVHHLYMDQSYLFKNDYDVKYELAFRCLDNKICIEINDLKVDFPETLSSGGWESVSFNYEDLFRKNGKINIKKKETLEKLQNHFNKVVYGLKNHIVSSNTSITFDQNK